MVEVEADIVGHELAEASRHGEPQGHGEGDETDEGQEEVGDPGGAVARGGGGRVAVTVALRGEIDGAVDGAAWSRGGRWEWWGGRGLGGRGRWRGSNLDA